MNVQSILVSVQATNVCVIPLSAMLLCTVLLTGRRQPTLHGILSTRYASFVVLRPHQVLIEGYDAARTMAYEDSVASGLPGRRHCMS
jgi:hypothetical protein